MKSKDFNRLADGAKQFIKTKAGKMSPSRAFEFSALDVKMLRDSLRKSQAEFAKMIGVRVPRKINLYG